MHKMKTKKINEGSNALKNKKMQEGLVFVVLDANVSDTISTPITYDKNDIFIPCYLRGNWMLPWRGG